jgi:hypothetical protein
VVGVSRCLRVVAYSKGRQRVHLEICPACGYDYDRGEDRHEHIAEHAPEDFGLPPLGESSPGHDAPLFGGEARGD